MRKLARWTGASDRLDARDDGDAVARFALLNVVWAVSIVCLEVPSGAVANLMGRRRIVILAASCMVVEMAGAMNHALAAAGWRGQVTHETTLRWPLYLTLGDAVGALLCTNALREPGAHAGAPPPKPPVGFFLSHSTGCRSFRLP